MIIYLEKNLQVCLDVCYSSVFKMISSPYCAFSRVFLRFLFSFMHDIIRCGHFAASYIHELISNFHVSRHFGCKVAKASCFILSQMVVVGKKNLKGLKGKVNSMWFVTITLIHIPSSEPL